MEIPPGMPYFTSRVIFCLFLAFGKKKSHKVCKSHCDSYLSVLRGRNWGGLCYLVYLSKALSQVINGNMLEANNVYASRFTVMGCKKGEKASFAVILIVVLS